MGGGVDNEACRESGSGILTGGLYLYVVTAYKVYVFLSLFFFCAGHSHFTSSCFTFNLPTKQGTISAIHDFF